MPRTAFVQIAVLVIADDIVTNEQAHEAINPIWNRMCKEPQVQLYVGLIIFQPSQKTSFHLTFRRLDILCNTRGKIGCVPTSTLTALFPPKSNMEKEVV